MNGEPANNDKDLLQTYISCCTMLTGILTDAIVIVSRDGILCYANEYAAQDLGQKADELTGKHIRELVGNYSDRFIYNLQGMLRSKKRQRFKEKFILRDKEFWFDTVLTPICDSAGTINYALIIFRDISTVKLKEIVLKQTEHFLRQIIQQTPFPIVVANREGMAVLMNQSFINTFALTTAQSEATYNLIRDTMMKTMKLEDHLEKVYKGNIVSIPSISFSFNRETSRLKAYRKDTLYYDVVIYPLTLENEEVHYAVIVWKDCTEHIHACRTLERSELKYRALFNNAIDPIIICDTLGNLLEINKRAMELFTLRKKDIAQMNFTYFHPPSEHKKLIRAFKKGILERNIYAGNVKAIDKNGKIFTVDLSGHIIEFDGQEVFQIILHQTEETKRRENTVLSLLKKLRLENRELRNKLTSSK